VSGWSWEEAHAACTETLSAGGLEQSNQTAASAEPVAMYGNHLFVGQRIPTSKVLSRSEHRHMIKGKRVALYLRVSTNGQTLDNQQRELLDAASRHGWEIVGKYRDEGISGAKGRDKRPALDKLLKVVARREIDLVAAWSVDRLGRSLQDLIGALGELHAKGVDLYLHQQGIDTSMPAGKALFQMLGVFAEFERAMIVERVKAGLARAKAAGTRTGRAIGWPKTTSEKESEIRQLLSAGTGIRRTARTVGVGVSVVQRLASAIL
jgi:DNA invertase Pin-like site-specific DNA recombinase